MEGRREVSIISQRPRPVTRSDLSGQRIFATGCSYAGFAG